MPLPKTNFHLSEFTFDKLRAKVKEYSGLYYGHDRHADLARNVDYFLSSNRNYSVEDIISSLDTLSRFCTYLTIGETYFFRHKAHFNYIAKYVKEKVSSLSSADEEIRIWSAACSSGEEPYSIAMALEDENLFSSPCKISIYASDLDISSIHKAKKGLYTDWSFREISNECLSRYFTTPKLPQAQKGMKELSPIIKSRVDFFLNNLVSPFITQKEAFVKPFDIILCRNVMIYFASDTITALGKLFHSMLRENGILLVSPAETSLISNMRLFRSIDIGNSFIFEKRTRPELCFDSPGEVPKPLPQTRKPLFVHKALPAKPKITPHIQKKEMGSAQKDPKILFDSKDYKGFIKCTSDEVSSILNKAFISQEQETLIKLHIKSLVNESLMAEAESCCLKAIEKMKLDTELHFIYAKILMENERPKEAATQLKKVLFLDHKNLIANFLLANLLLSENLNEQARKYFENVLSLLSGMPPEKNLPEADGSTVEELRTVTSVILSNLSSEHVNELPRPLKESEPQKIEPALPKLIIENKPVHDRTHPVLSVALQKPKIAQPLIPKKITEDRKPDARSLFDSKKYSKLIEEYSHEIASTLSKLQFSPDQQRLIKIYIKSLLKESRIQEAETCCLKALKLMKLDPELNLIHASILIEATREIEAIQSLKKVLYLDLNNPIAHFLMGNILLSQNSRNQAEKHFEAASAILSALSPDIILTEADGSTVRELKLCCDTIISTLTPGNSNE